MRAVVHTRYGPPEVQRVLDVERPVPNADEVLVEVRATTVNRTDCASRIPTPGFARVFTGMRRPKRTILGSEFAGVVAEVGDEVTSLAVGEEVFGVNAGRLGAHAGYVRVRESAPIAPKPADMTFEEAAAVCDGAVLGMTCVEWSRVGAGQRVLVYGASGSIGTACVQLARHLGAHVTAVCTEATFDLIRALGADEVADHTVEDFTTSGETYDVVIDAVGKRSHRDSRAALADGGTFVATELGPLSLNPVLSVWTKWFGRTRVMMPIPRYTREKVLRLRELIEAGEYRAVIDRSYSLDEVVEATRYVESEQKVGNVVVTVGGGER